MAVYDRGALRCFQEKTGTILSMGKKNEDEVGEVDCSVILLHKVKRGGVICYQYSNNVTDLAGTEASQNAPLGV